MFGALIPLLLASPQGFGHSTTVQVPDEYVVRDARLVDVDLDGRTDIVVTGWRNEGKGTRTLRVYLRQPGDRIFEATPDYELELTRDVSAWAVADVHEDPGAEVMLFTSRAAFYWRPVHSAAGGENAVGRLLDTRFLWQRPERRDTIAWTDGVVDFDGDGRSDLLLPEPGAYRVALQDGTHGFSNPSSLRVPRENELKEPTIAVSNPPSRPWRLDMRRSSSSFSLGLDEDTGSALLRIDEEVPAPSVLDWDGDGDLDLIAQNTRELCVWLLDDAGRFPSAPTHRLPLPVERDISRELDISYSAHAGHIDDDGRADCVIFASDKRAKDVRTQVMVFTHAGPSGELFGNGGMPQDVIVLGGFAGFPQFHDVDGDGRDDLVVTTLRPDLIDTIRTATSKRIDVSLHVYLNQGGRFSPRPELTHKMSVSLDDGDFEIRFVGDVTGDGVSELLVRDTDDRLRLLMVRRARGGWTLVERPLWQRRIDKDADIQIGHGGEDGKPEVLIIEREQVLHEKW